MFKIFIVDDEMLSRYTLRKVISKEFCGIFEIEEYENGKIASEIAIKSKPHIVIMDYKMPLMNGLESSKIILEHNKDTIIIMLTAYGDFSYIQKAMNIGIKGYFLKPLNENEIVLKLHNVIDYINKSENENYKEKDRAMKIIKPIIDKELISSYIYGNFAINDIKNYHNFLNYSIDSGYFMLVTIDEMKALKIEDIVRIKILKTKISALLVEILYFLKPCLVGDFTSKTVPIFVPMEENSHNSESYVFDESKIIASEIIKKIKSKFDLDASVSIGNIYYEPENFKQSYNEAASLISHLVFGKIGIYKNFHFQHDTFSYPYESENLLINAIKQKNAKEAKLVSEEICQYLFNDNLHSLKTREYVAQLFVSIKRTLYEMGIDLNLSDSFVKLTDLEYMTDLIELEAYTKTSIDYLIYIISAQNENRNYAVIERINKYFSENAIYNVSLEKLANHLNLSVQYLSKVFKDEFGENFIDYVTKIKIQKAKELLKTTDLSVGEIANYVGYSDQNYFCKTFKKSTGVTPKNYKKVH